jgi:hypothetical protein
LVNAQAFFNAIRSTFGPLSQTQVDGYNALLAGYADSQWQDPRWFAYLLATAWHETDFTMQPVKEAFWETEDWRHRNLRYYPWYGRGFVQLTWATNYERADHELNLIGALTRDPDLALNLSIATKVIFRGMAEGWFTGKKLGDYIFGDTCDYVGSRRIVNGLDKAAAIAVYATKFEKCVKALESDNEKRLGGSTGQVTQEVHPEGDQKAGSAPQGPGGAAGSEDPGSQGGSGGQAAGQGGATGEVRPDAQGTQQVAKGTSMGTFITLLLPMIEKYISDHAQQIEQDVLNEIEKWAESLFTKVNAANPVTPDKTVVSK